MVRLQGESSNSLFDELAEWNECNPPKKAVDLKVENSYNYV